MKRIHYWFTASSLLLSALLLSSVAVADTPAKDLAAPGESQVCTIHKGLKRWGYASARISYPCGLSEKVPAVTLTGGFVNIKEQMYWLADHLTSHGYIVIAITPYNILGDPTVWKHAHMAGIRELQVQNRTWWSPVRGKVNQEQLGVMGYSNGGGGALLAAGELGDTLKTVTALAPNIGDEQPQFDNISAQTQIISGALDEVTLPSSVGSYYDSLPVDISRNLSVLRGLSHLEWVGFGDFQTPRTQAKILITAWLNLQMRDDPAFGDWFSGEQHNHHLAEDWFTRYDYQP